MPACGFETADDIEQWTIVADSAVLTSSPVHSGIGAALLSSTSPNDIRVHMSCFPVSGSGAVRFGIYVFPVAGPVWCKLTAFQYENPDCSGFFSIYNGTQSEYPPGDWSLIRSPPVTHFPGATFTLSCNSSNPVEIIVDDAFWGEGMVPVTLQTVVIE
jgi:hypothetical protein